MPRSDFSTEKNPSHPAVNQFGGFAADYHHGLGPALADFPRSLALPSPASENICCWPDFATFIEDNCGRQMMYYPAHPSPWSVCVLFCAESGSWSTQLYRDADPIS